MEFATFGGWGLKKNGPFVYWAYLNNARKEFGRGINVPVLSALMHNCKIAHLAFCKFSAKHDLPISNVRGLPMAQGWVSKLVGSFKDILASKSPTTRCPLGSAKSTS